jgi:FG-GAP-like repeat
MRKVKTSGIVNDVCSPGYAHYIAQSSTGCCGGLQWRRQTRFRRNGETGATEQNWEFDVFLGHGDGTFTQLAPQLFSPLGTDAPQQLLSVDLNNDGKPDLLIGLNANGGWVASGDDLMRLWATEMEPSRRPPFFFHTSVPSLQRVTQ